MIHGNPTTPANNFTTIPGDTSSAACFIWCPSYRPRSTGNGDAQRNASSVFFRGISERMSIQVGAGGFWQWRRIVFSTKGLRPESSFQEVGTSLRRTMAPFFENTFIARLFQGTQGVDWISILFAKTDKNRVHVISDRTRTIAPRTTGNHLHTYKAWVPINKTLVYDDEENGSLKDASGWSSNGIAGYGDIFFFDIFVPATFGTTQELTITTQATTYWHER